MTAAMYLFLEHLLVVLGVTAVALSVAFALQQRRSPQSSAAWVLFIIVLPYLAVPLFLALGFRKKRRSYVPIHFDPWSEEVEEPPPAARLLSRMGAAPATRGNRVALHTTPDEARIALDEVIDRAGERLDALLYVLARDESGRRFLARLTEKARAGVKVRLCIDWLGSLMRPRREIAALRRAGGEVHVFSPLLHLTERGPLNLRNHRKMVIADDAMVWAGGRNVGDEYLVETSGGWHDLSFVATGPIVRGFSDIFHADWDASGRGEPPDPATETVATGDAIMQIVPAGPDEPLDLLHDGLVNLIHRADRRVWIATPYFVPTEALAQALGTAARRAIDVRIMVPDHSNQWTADLARGPYLREAARAGCRILRFGPGMMHAKAGLIDGTGWLGSANLDVRSMLLNFEIGVFAHDAPTVNRIESWFAALGPQCLEGAPRASRRRRLVESVFRLGAPIL